MITLDQGSGNDEAVVKEEKTKGTNETEKPETKSKSESKEEKKKKKKEKKEKKKAKNEAVIHEQTEHHAEQGYVSRNMKHHLSFRSLSRKARHSKTTSVQLQPSSMDSPELHSPL